MSAGSSSSIVGRTLGIGDIYKADPNVHAGTEFLAKLMDDYFKDARFDDQNRTLFAFAAYGMGTGALRSVRREAAAERLDPNVWFNNVERAAAARVGAETPRAVRNIYEYYVAYKLIEEADAAKKGPQSAQPSLGQVRTHRHSLPSHSDAVWTAHALL